MNAGVIAVFIPIITVLVIGLIFVTFFYYRSRERQMLIEKGLSATDMKTYFERRKDPYLLLKIGIISVGFGIGLGLGLYFEDTYDVSYSVPLFLFTVTGIGFIVANLISNKLELKAEKNN